MASEAAEQPREAEKETKVKTLIMPAVAVGNVGQIAVDILGKQPRFRSVTEPLDNNGLLLPCVGNVPPKNEMSISLELQELDDFHSLLHIKSMVVPGRSSKFAKFIVNLAKQRGFKRIVILGGASALGLIQEEQFSRTRSTIRTVGRTIDEEGFMPLEYQVSELKLTGLLPFVTEESIKTEIETEALLLFVFEGENWPDGVQMAKSTMRYLEL